MNAMKNVEYKGYLFQFETQDDERVYISSRDLTGFHFLLEKDEPYEQDLIPAIDKFLEYKNENANE